MTKQEKLDRPKKIALARVLKHAPFHLTIAEVCKVAKVQRPTLYRYFDQFPEMRDEIQRRLGTDCPTKLTPKEKKVNAFNQKVEQEIAEKFSAVSKKDLKELTAYRQKNLPDIGVPKPESEEMAIIKGLRVCELIESGRTPGEACDEADIHYATFFRMTKPESHTYNHEIAIAYAESKISFQEMYNDELKMSSIRIASDLLKVREVTTTLKSGTVDKNGKIKASHIKHTTRKENPNLATAKFILEKLAPQNFGTPEERKEMNQDKPIGLDYTHRNKSLAELEAEEQALMNDLELSNQKENAPENLEDNGHD